MKSFNIPKVYADRKVWFSMWFLGAIVTFGVALFPMFYRLVEGRNLHFAHETEIEGQVTKYLKDNNKEPPTTSEKLGIMNSKMWTISILLIVPFFLIIYLLCRDLFIHERNQDNFLSAAFPQRMFMPQTIPIKKYVLITIVTLGVGVVYWLYKTVNLYNAHFKAHLLLEKEISRLIEEKKVV